MFYLLLAAQLTILFAIAASGWVKLNAYFRSYDVRWVFTGLACLLMTAGAVFAGCIYFEAVEPPPRHLRISVFMEDEQARLKFFIACCLVTLGLTTATIVGLRRKEAGIFAPSRARTWRYRRLAKYFAATIVTLVATIAVDDWICRRELASWRAEGEQLLDDLATRYPPAGDQETALEQYERIVERSHFYGKSLIRSRTAIHKGRRPPSTSNQGKELLRSLGELHPTPACNLRNWLDQERLDDAPLARVFDIEELLMRRLKRAEPEEFWRLMRMWSEIVERLARDPTTHFDTWLVGMEMRMTRLLAGAILNNAPAVSEFRADSWDAEPDYFLNLADRLQWMEARNLLLMSDVGLARYEHPLYRDSWMYMPDQYPAVSTDANKSFGFRMEPSFWKETKPYHDGMRRMRKIAALPATAICRAVLAEYGRPPTVDEQRTNGYRADSVIIDMPFLDGKFFSGISDRTKACLTRRLTKLSLACSAFALENGTPPERLSDLVPKYLTKIPIDPCSGREYCYRRNGNEFKIYSVDRDCRDDGGAFTQVDGDAGWEFVVQDGMIQAK